MIPYVLDLLLMLSYPKAFEGTRGKLNWDSIVEHFPSSEGALNWLLLVGLGLTLAASMGMLLFPVLRLSPLSGASE